jgi:DNA-binding response OmpR family regulator
MTATLLLIDDDPLFCQVIQFALVQKCFEVEVAHDGLSGLEKASTLKPDVVLLDIRLPDISGWEVCSRLREMTGIPIIMLTGLGAEEHIVEGLDLGADDYIIKPVTPEELVARIGAVLRRASPWNGGNAASFQHIFRHANLIIDFERHQVTVDGKRVCLTRTEYRLLSVLARHRGQVLTHEALLLQAWGPEHVAEIHHLHLYINYLRRKLETDPSRPRLIRSEWGVGYYFG